MPPCDIKLYFQALQSYNIMSDNVSNTDCKKLNNAQSYSIFIDPLQGCVFDLSVNPEDTVLSVKEKIEELKGIPVSQQQLLLNLRELDDQATLGELSVGQEAKIQLVVALRSGPVSSLRKIVPEMSSSLLKDLIIQNRKEFGNLQPGTRLSIMVFRDGTKIKMFKMLEKLDSSLLANPLSASSSRGSSYKQSYPKSQRTMKCHEDPKIVQKVKLIKAKLLEQKNLRKKEVAPHENESSSTNQTLGENVLPAKKKLPPLSASLIDKEETHQRMKVEFSQVPVLPNIGPTAVPICDTSYSEASVVTDVKPACDKTPSYNERINDFSSVDDPSLAHFLDGESKKSLIIEETDAFPERSIRNGGSKFKSKLKCSVPCRSDRKMLDFPNSETSKETLAEKKEQVYPTSRTLTNRQKSDLFNSRSNEVEDCIPTKKHLLTPRAEFLDVGAFSSNENGGEIEPLTLTQEVIQPKKKIKNRCSECRKKLTISNMYECRCGLLLCSSHRYSEAHTCSFDYKIEGRKMIKKVNPLVIAPKLPKI